MKSTHTDLFSLEEEKKQPIQISILCMTFNHEKYIAKALDSFLMQDVDVRFEIIVHDDCSTDSTGDIIRSYEKKYPNIVRSIIQTENLYSQQIKITPIVIGAAKGRYIAFCEGDDFWTSNRKLQLQLNALRSYPEIDLCFHPSFTISRNKAKGKICHYSNKTTIFSLNDVIAAGGAFMPTPSLFFRASALKTLPNWFITKAPVGDKYLQILGSIRGGAIYLPKAMCTYQILTENSWTYRVRKISEKEILEHLDNTFFCYQQLKRDIEINIDESLKIAKASDYFQFSSIALENGFYNLFESLIVKSFKKSKVLESKAHEIKQKIFYFFRKFKSFLRLVIFLNRALK